jgi:DNA-binding transcriptional MocR family regulator
MTDNQELNGFAMIPYEVLLDPRLSSNAVKLYGVMYRYHTMEKGILVGQKKFAEDMGVSRATVIRLLDKLEACGHIEINRGGKPLKGSNKYSKSVYKLVTLPIAKMQQASESPISKSATGATCKNATLNKSELNKNEGSKKSPSPVSDPDSSPSQSYYEQFINHPQKGTG